MALWRSLPSPTYVRTRGASCFECVGEWAEISKPRPGPKQCPHVIITSHNRRDQAFPIFQRATLKNTGRPGYEARKSYKSTSTYVCPCLHLPLPCLHGKPLQKDTVLTAPTCATYLSPVSLESPYKWKN